MLSLQTVVPHTLELLRGVMSQELFADTRLVGGTSLALQYGHRSSIDLDFFGQITTNTSQIKDCLGTIGQVVQLNCSERIKSFMLDDVKLDVVIFPYPWLEAPVEEEGLRLASPPDIAAMKIGAIEGRGSKKDFIDMYFLLQHYTFTEIMQFYKQKYPEHSEFMALRSITYFEDADNQDMPQMFVKGITWNKIKEYIIAQVEKYVNTP